MHAGVTVPPTGHSGNRRSGALKPPSAPTWKYPIKPRTAERIGGVESGELHVDALHEFLREDAVTARSADLWRITPNHFSCSPRFARVREVTVSRGKGLFARVRG